MESFYQRQQGVRVDFFRRAGDVDSGSVFSRAGAAFPFRAAGGRAFTAGAGRRRLGGAFTGGRFLANFSAGQEIKKQISAWRGYFGNYCGGGGEIRTRGGFWPQRFSRPSPSTAQTPLLLFFPLLLNTKNH